MFYMILFLLVGTFIGEYESSYFKQHHTKFTPAEYIWIMSLGSLLINILLLVTMGGYDWAAVNLQVIVTTIALSILSRFFFTFSFHAIDVSERSTSSNFGVLSVPLVLLADVLLGYDISSMQIGAMIVIVLVFFLAGKKGGFSRESLRSSLATVGVGAASIIIFKYSTSHWISIQHQSLLTALGTMSILLCTQLPALRTLLQRRDDAKVSCGLAFFYGIASMVNAFAFNFGLASVVTTVKRVLQLMRGLIFGKVEFHEQHMMRKTLITAILAVCVIGLQFPSLLYAMTNILH